MSDEAQTTPVASVESRMSALFGGGQSSAPAQAKASTPEPAQAAPEPTQTTPEPQATSQTSEEVTVDDLPDDEPQAPAGLDADGLEITYNGQPLKLSKDEARERAQLGEHFRRNQTQAEAAWAAAGQAVQRAQAVVQMAPQIQQAAGVVAMYQQALNSIDPAQMRTLASTDPAKYLEERARIDELVAGANNAQAQLNSLQQQFGEHQQRLTEAQTAQEYEVLGKKLPQWRDPQRYAKDATELVNALKRDGVRPQTLAALDGNAELLAMAHKAVLYDRLQASKREKLQTANGAPQVARPGSATSAGAASEDRARALRADLKKTGSVASATRLLAMRFK